LLRKHDGVSIKRPKEVSAFIFVILSLLTVAGAVAALSLRNLVHCALSLTLAFGGLAGLYLQLDAQFVGFAQILIYVGAVAILILFAVLLTRGSEPPQESILSQSWIGGLLVALVVFGLLTTLILRSSVTHGLLPSVPQVSVRELGEQLITKYILPLEVIGQLLTAALIGAVIIAMHEKKAE
jgi:NADH-quinone oxidoreductase subunit J